MVKNTMTETVPSWRRGGTTAVMAQNEQTTEEHFVREQQCSHREGLITQRGASCGRYDQRHKCKCMALSIINSEHGYCRRRYSDADWKGGNARSEAATESTMETMEIPAVTVGRRSLPVLRQSLFQQPPLGLEERPVLLEHLLLQLQRRLQTTR